MPQPVCPRCLLAARSGLARSQRHWRRRRHSAFVARHVRPRPPFSSSFWISDNFSRSCLPWKTNEETRASIFLVMLTGTCCAFLHSKLGMNFLSSNIYIPLSERTPTRPYKAFWKCAQSNVYTLSEGKQSFQQAVPHNQHSVGQIQIQCIYLSPCFGFICQLRANRLFTRHLFVCVYLCDT